MWEAEETNRVVIPVWFQELHRPLYCRLVPQQEHGSEKWHLFFRTTRIWNTEPRDEGGKSQMTINKIRSVLYGLAKFLGDVNAIEKNKIGRRIGRRLMGKLTGRLLGRLFR